MKKIYILIICISFFSNTNAQEPYFGTAGADGLGQYGYLDKNSVTFSRIFRNSYNNIAFLSARWWITDNNAANGNGKEFIYNVFSGPDWNPAIGWQCGGDNDGSKRTTDFVAADFSPEWSAGSDCYVSVCAKYCDNSFSPNSFNGATTFGAVGFNERHFQVIEVNTAAHTSTASFIPNTSGICQTSNAVNVAGSFSIDPGTISGISLSSLFVKNKGTAMEGTDIPNNALHVYYETATGSERYGDGNETFAGTLNGNWDGNVTDNIFGSSVLSIPLNGKIRVYVLLCEYNRPLADNKTVNLSLINDGIFLLPQLNSFSKIRIDTVSISNRNIILPLRFVNFGGSRNNMMVQLQWMANLIGSNGHFIIQQSNDGSNFTNAGMVTYAANTTTSNYSFALNTYAEYFRIVSNSDEGEKIRSNIIRIRNNKNGGIKLLGNVAENGIILESSFFNSSIWQLGITDEVGRLLLRQQKMLQPGANFLPLPSIAAKQLLFLQLQNSNGESYLFKVLKK